MKRPKVVCIGVATHDFIALAEGWAGPDQRVVAEDVMQAGGGPAATAAVALARLGVPVSFIGRVGDDESGARIVADLEREGVEASRVRCVGGARSAASVIVADRGSGGRAIAAYPGSVGPIALTVAEIDFCGGAEWIHVDQFGYGVVAALREAGVKTPVSLDGGNPIPDLDLEPVTLYSPTEARLRAVFGVDDAFTAARMALDAGPSMVVWTRGPAGSMAVTRHKTFEEPAYVGGAVVSTLGAGDVFHGAMLAALVKGLGVGEMLRYANAAAALSCRALDGRSAIPGAMELEEALR